VSGKLYPDHTLAVVQDSRWRKYDGPYAMFYDLSDHNINPPHNHGTDRELDVWVLQSVEREVRMTTYNEVSKHALDLRPQLGNPEWLLDVIVLASASTGNPYLRAIIHPDTDLAQARRMVPNMFNGIPVEVSLGTD
jgi:hypothetical protein